MFYPLPSPNVQTPIVTRGPCLPAAEEQPVHQPTVSGVGVPLGPVEYTDPPDATLSFLVAIPVACRKGVGEIPAGAWTQEGPTAADGLSSGWLACDDS